LVVLATTDGSSVDADVETATSFVRYHVTPERAVFIDLVGRWSVTPWTHTKSPLNLGALPPCDLLVVVATRKKASAIHVPALALTGPIPLADVLAAIQAAAGGAGPTALVTHSKQTARFPEVRRSGVALMSGVVHATNRL
jgi:hypothetical protein